jgi:hypothetical protein
MELKPRPPKKLKDTVQRVPTRSEPRVAWGWRWVVRIRCGRRRQVRVPNPNPSADIGECRRMLESVSYRGGYRVFRGNPNMSKASST